MFFQELTLEQLYKLSIDEKKYYIFDLASELGLLVNFQEIPTDSCVNSLVDYKDIMSSFDGNLKSIDEESLLINELNDYFGPEENSSNLNFPVAISAKTNGSGINLNNNQNGVNTNYANTLLVNPNSSSTNSSNINLVNSNSSSTTLVNQNSSSTTLANNFSLRSLERRCDSTLPLLNNTSNNEICQISDEEFTKFLQENQNINEIVVRHNSNNIRTIRNNNKSINHQKETTQFLKRSSTLETTNKYGCKLCSEIHFTSNLKSRKQVKAHEPMMYLVRNFLLRYDVAPNAQWKTSFIRNDESFQLDMLERFFCIILPDHENDYFWSYVLRKRSYETRYCTWSSSEGDCSDLKKRNILDLFVTPYRELRPAEIRKSPNIVNRTVLSRTEINNNEKERVVNNILSTLSSSPVEVNVAMSSLFYDPKEFEEQDLQISKRKREE